MFLKTNKINFKRVKIMKIYDISMPIKEKMLVYPGDRGFEFNFIKKIPPEDWNLSIFSIGTHTGTHLDSSLHLFKNGKRLNATIFMRFKSKNTYPINK